MVILLFQSHINLKYAYNLITDLVLDNDVEYSQTRQPVLTLKFNIILLRKRW